jgi:putative spermidine/putrescine transport system permease protein
MIKDTSLAARLWNTVVWAFIGFFVINLLAMIASVLTSSFATRWLGTWLPSAFTTRWYGSAWSEFQLTEVLTVTFQAVFLVVLFSALLGVPAAYALARREFKAKRLVMLLFLLPLLIPPITFGIPLATVLYQTGFAGSLTGVVLANLVPTVPFVVLVMVPFVEQIDPRIEAAARVFGASTPQLFFSQTLVVALYYAVFAAGVRAVQSIDAMAVIYMVTTLVWLIIALRFVNPTQLVGRSNEQAAH